MKAKIKTLSVAVSAAVMMSAWSLPASATTWMTDFYNTAGASINVTPGAVYQTQTTNVISGGGFAVRAPRKNVQLLNITPPGFKAGCGGIDFWAGSFGFINKEQLVQFLRNIGQNALGLFFQLALKSMAPEVAATIEVMQDWAQRINQFNMNSCEQAQQFINADTLDFMIPADAKERATNHARWMGTKADQFLSALGVRDSAEATRATQLANKAAVPNQYKNDYTIDTNITWKMLSRVPDMSKSEKELVMSIVGTIITGEGVDDTGEKTMKPDPYPPQIGINELVGSRNAATSAKIYSCADATDCLSLSSPPAEVSYQSFAQVAFTKMNNIKSKIVTKTAQDPVDLALVDMTSVPIYRLISVTTLSKYPGMSTTVIEKYADVVGLELAMHYLEYISEEVSRQIKIEKAKASSAIIGHFESLEKRLQELLQQGRAKRLEMINERSALMAHVGEIEHIERSLYSNLSATMAANLRFGQKM